LCKKVKEIHGLGENEIVTIPDKNEKAPFPLKLVDALCLKEKGTSL
jgi:hypothetical protein